MANSVIPQEIIDSIIEAVGNDTRLLKKCALVSSSFLLPARKLLFSKIYLSTDQACQMIHQFLVENPVIQSFVKWISIGWNWDDLNDQLNLNHTSLIGILRLPFCCLEIFAFTSGILPFNWNDFSSDLKNALSTIILSPSLKTLRLLKIQNVPITFFQGIHLTHLVLSSLWLSKQSVLLTPAALEGVATTASHTVVDRCSWHFSDSEPLHGTKFPTFVYLLLIWDTEGFTEPVFLPFMCRLRVFEIHINPFSATMRDSGVILSLLMRSLRVSLTSPATLEHLKISISSKGKNDGGFFALFDGIRDAGVWSHLDSIITHPTGSRIQAVDIHFTYGSYFEHDVVELDETAFLAK